MSTFKEKILQGFDIESQEAGLVTLLLIQSSFLGIFFGAFDTAANSLFLGAFPAKDLPMAFTVSGLVGILMTALYSYLQERLRFSHLAIYNIAFISIITFILWYGFNVTTAKWHVFIVLVMMGPLNILAMIGFWGTAGRIFSLRQGKRLFGLVDTGQIIGVILSSYAIPIILSFEVKTKDILLISSISAAVALVFQIIVVLKNKNLSIKVEKNASEPEQYSFSHLFKNRFVKLMAFFVAISMVVAFFISFSFLAVLKMKYPDELGMAKFLGIFTGTVMIFTLIIKTFVYSKFVKTYGLRTCLIISPILLLFLTIIAALIGTFAGYTAAASGFLFFFLLITLSRLISVSLKSSIEAPSFKILYQTIGSNLRHHIQSRIDGTVNEISALSSGIILFVLGLLSFFSILNFSHALIFILILWTFIAYNLYKAYKNNLDQSLTSFRTDDHISSKKDINGIASTLLKGNEDSSRVLFVMNMQEKLQPVLYERLIPYLLHHRLTEIQQYAITQINSRHIYEALDTLKMYDEEPHKEKCQNISRKLAEELILLQQRDKITALSRSKIASERELAARLIANIPDQEMVHHLKFLLRDFDANVKIAAIKSATQFKGNEIATILSEFLSSPQFGRFASDALINLGNSCLDSLDHLFNKSANDTILLTRIINIIGQIGGEKANNLLLHKITYHDMYVARLSAKMLLKNQFKTNETNEYLIFQALQHIFHLISWNIAAKVSLREGNADESIQNALQDETKSSYDHLFTLLSILYDAQSILHIRQNIEGEGAESADYAIELLELLIADNLKPILFPIIDDSSDHEKIKKLQEYFPVDKMPLDELLIDIINRDFNYIGTWTKACALNLISSKPTWKVTNDIISQLFNPDEMLSQQALIIINKNQPWILSGIFKRLPEKTRIKHQKSLELLKENPNNSIFNKVLELKKIENLRAIQGNTLYYLSSHLRISTFEENEEVESLDEDLNVLVHLVLNGEVQAIENTGFNTYNEGCFFGGIFAPGYPADFPRYIVKKTSLVGSITQEIFDKILFDHPEFAQEIMNEKLTENI